MKRKNRKPDIAKINSTYTDEKYRKWAYEMDLHFLTVRKSSVRRWFRDARNRDRNKSIELVKRLKSITMTQIKSGYITGSNQQLQELRPHLVKEGFVDDKEWNDNKTSDINNSMSIYGNNVNCVFGLFTILSKLVSSDDGKRLLYTLSPNEDLEEAAKIIKDKFYA